MGRTKTHKEYTVKLIHPEFGEYYLYYLRNNGYGNKRSYIFTKNLNKVLKWKTIKYAEDEVKSIKTNLDYNQVDVLLYFGEEICEELKPRMIYSRKKYYFRIDFVSSPSLIDIAQNNINTLNISLVNDSELITESIKNGDHIEKDFIKTIKKLESQISSYRTDYFFLEKCKTNGVLIDIVDASYGFRLLKLKNLKMFSETDKELEK